MAVDYARHPFIAERLEVLPDVPLAVIDGLALANWTDSHPGATPEEVRAVMLDPEYVLWSSHPIDALPQIASIVQIEPVGDWPLIRVLELAPLRDV